MKELMPNGKKPISTIIEECYTLPDRFSVLECGAFSVEYLETENWVGKQNVWLIEPLEEGCKDLRKITSQVIQTCLTDYTGDVEFTVNTSEAGHSTIEYHPEHWEILKQLSLDKTHSQSARCIDYKTLQDNLSVVFDILVLDIEEHESTVLKSMLPLDPVYLPKVFCIECGYDWSKKKEVLNKLGYQIDFYSFNNCYLSRPSDSFVPKKEETQAMNEANRAFIYGGRLIYDNP